MWGSATAPGPTGEPPALRDRYGRYLFGQGCPLARRLVEHGVPFVEVTPDGWDTHAKPVERGRPIRVAVATGTATRDVLR